MTYTLLVMDRGRAIARHRELSRDEAVELAAAYQAIGWPGDKIIIQRDVSQAAA